MLRESHVQACNQRTAVSTFEGVHFTIALETLIVVCVCGWGGWGLEAGVAGNARDKK